MKTIEQYKAAAIYFPPGRIIPNWVLRIVKGHKKYKRNMKFGTNVWVLPCGDRFVIFGELLLPGTFLIHLENVHNVAVTAARGMQNIFLGGGSGSVTAQKIFDAISRPLPDPTSITLGKRGQIKGTKLQRRRAKFAAVVDEHP